MVVIARSAIPFALPSLLRCLLIPAFLLANLLCLCGHAAAATHAVQVDCCGRPIPTAKSADCCDTQHSKNPTDPTCPHCRDKGNLLISSNVDQATAHLLHPLAMLCPLDALLPLTQPSLDRKAITWQIDPGPPPDRLSLLCVLQV